MSVCYQNGKFTKQSLIIYKKCAIGVRNKYSWQGRFGFIEAGSSPLNGLSQKLNQEVS